MPSTMDMLRLFIDPSFWVCRLLGPKRNSLPGLPAQVLLRIAELLSRDDITCTSLCSHRLYALLKTRDPSTLRTRRDKLALLARLGRDLPKSYVCHSCLVFHRHDHSEVDPLEPISRFILGCPRLAQHYVHESQLFSFNMKFRYRFHFIHLQLLMMRFYLGPEYGIGTEDISYTEVQLHSLQPGTQLYLISSVDAEICSTHPSLILRVQQIISVDRHKRYLLYRCPWPPSMKRFKIPPHSITICSHAKYQDISTWINKVVKAHRAGEKAPCVSFACSFCGTEAILELVEFENQLALVITKWIDLGAGVTLEDRQWRGHELLEDWPTLFKGGGYAHMRSTEGEFHTEYFTKPSARACFERASRESLQSRNIAYLKDQRFKKCMIYKPTRSAYEPHTWYLSPATHRSPFSSFCSYFDL
ncbi:unnamed protein product [Penicillium olsonii]|uniref:F-box domain-containing protein n=1 Tax=Penicillium olsonii TaxID=99116 RepID=A0A9W4MV48_PENOL|nr:unnamed protein product [Penicillium olsonii]CAG8277518.1 unnamed protein product [Penicillium olsonii]